MIRYGGIITIGMAYNNTANEYAIKKLLNKAVYDSNDDVKRYKGAFEDVVAKEADAMDPEMVIPPVAIIEPVTVKLPINVEEPDTLSEPDTTG